MSYIDIDGNRTELSWPADMSSFFGRGWYVCYRYYDDFTPRLQSLTSAFATQRLVSILELPTISLCGIPVIVLNIVRLCSSVRPVSPVPSPVFWRMELLYVSILL